MPEDSEQLQLQLDLENETEEAKAERELKEEAEEKLKGDLPDPLDTLIEGLDPAQIQKRLLGSPKVRSSMQSWASKGANAQVQAAERGIEERVTREAQLKGIEQQIAAMSPEELAEQLTNNPKFRETYATVVVDRRDQGQKEWKESLIQESQVYSNTTIFGKYNEFIQKSPMSDEVKAQVVPQNYADADDPMGAYINAVIDAWATYKAQAIYDGELRKNLDAATQDQQAGNGDGGSPPDLSGGRPKLGSITREKLAKMTQEEIQALPVDEVNKALATPTRR